MLSIYQLNERLNARPHLAHVLSITNILQCLTYLHRLRNDIILIQPPTYTADQPPRFLPDAIRVFLGQAMGVPVDIVDECWEIFRDLVWCEDLQTELAITPLHVFREIGPPRGIAYHTFFPPHHFCISQHCWNKKPLKKAHSREVVLYTLQHGSIPSYAVQLYCQVCKTDYHHNYYVQGSRRVYYEGVPANLEIGDHLFVEGQLIKMWLSSMLYAQTSAGNCARLYNKVLSQASSNNSFSFSPFLRQNHVWDAVIIWCLLEDCHGQDAMLDVSHTGDQKDRFLPAMRVRNVRIQRYGQPELRHRCWKCVRYFDQRAEGKGIKKVAVVVIDGVTIGHPCCGVHNCQEPLKSQRHRFCPSHTHLNAICSVVGCSAPVVPPTRVCQDRSHITVWERHNNRGQSRFLLQQRLENARQQHGRDDRHQWNEESGEEIFILDHQGRVVGEDHALTGTTESSPHRLRAKFGRRRTHNEEIATAPCGVIIGRTTFYGSEGVASVVDFVKQTYRHAPRPDHIFYDNNCTLAKHVKGDSFFDDIGLSVDVFHFKSKHSVNDTFCQQNCNPRAFPELLRPDNGWYFNSSAAEQTNVWAAGYHSICKEMTVDKYNFFLDEMVMRRNADTVQKLHNDGFLPSYWDI